MLAFPRHCLFTPRKEIAHLLIPLSLLLVCLWEVLKGPSLLSSNYTELNFIADIFLFDTLHTAFTFIFVANTSAGRRWLSQNLSPRFHVISFFMILAYTWWFGMAFKIFPPWLGPEALAIGSLLLLGVARHHSLSQIRGLSFAYDYSFQKTALNQNTIRSNHKIERHCITAILLVHLLYIGVNRHSPEWRWLAMPMYLATFALIFGALIYIQFRLPKELRNSKIVFLGRLSMYAFLPLAPVAFSLTTQVLHGVESFFVYDKMFGKSEHKVNLTAVIAVYLPLLTLCAYGAYMGLLTHPGIIAVLLTFRSVHTYYHYLIERWIFRMRNESSRREILPLLIDRPA